LKAGFFFPLKKTVFPPAPPIVEQQANWRGSSTQPGTTGPAHQAEWADCGGGRFFPQEDDGYIGGVGAMLWDGDDYALVGWAAFDK